MILRLFRSPSWKHLLQVLMQYFETISIFYAYLNKPASKSKRFFDKEVIFKQTVDSKGSIHIRVSSFTAACDIEKEDSFLDKATELKKV